MPFRSLSFGLPVPKEAKRLRTVPARGAKALQYRHGSQTQNPNDTYPPFYTGGLVKKIQLTDALPQ
jgi:hypothetical protein